MQAFPIVTEPTPSLRKRSQEVAVEEITTPEFQAYLDQLVHTMFVSDGVGIASSQVGKNIRAIVVNASGKAECYMNPVITKRSEVMVESEEGCLSVPGTFGIVMRHKKITVEAINRHGRRVTMELKQFPAIVFQHEIDHIDGILFIDKAIKVVKRSGRAI
jgi:peptide deformylase